MTDVILVVVIVAFFVAMASLVPALSRLIAVGADTDEDEAGLDGLDDEHSLPRRDSMTGQS